MSRYRGWVPNKTGKLSFSQIGKQNPEDIIFYKKHDCEQSCNYFIAQNRSFKLDDSIFNVYSRFGSTFANAEDIIFVISATCKKKPVSSDNLIGQVWVKYGKIKGNNFQSEIGDCDKVFSANFIVKRDGACKVSGLNFGDTIIYDGEYSHVEEWAASQTYMFLKDILHRHKHHPKSSDTFLDIRTVAQGQPWKRHVAYNLGKMAIKSPDVDKPETFQNTLGVISYLQSLIGTHEIRGLYEESNIVAWKASLNAEYSNVLFHVTGRRWFSGAVIAFYTFCGARLVTWDEGLTIQPSVYIIGYVALVLSLFQFSNIYSALKFQNVIDLFSLLSKSRLISTLLIVLICFLIFFYIVMPRI